MERETVVICILMDANTNWLSIFFLSLFENCCETFTTSKDHSKKKFYRTHTSEWGIQGETGS